MDINNILIEKCNNKNIEIIHIVSYKGVFINKNMINPIKYTIFGKNKVDKTLFQNEFLNYQLDWSIKGVSVVLTIREVPFCVNPEELAESNSKVTALVLNDGRNSCSLESIDA